jgi:putative hydrolase of the HAD superfamily
VPEFDSAGADQAVPQCVFLDAGGVFLSPDHDLIVGILQDVGLAVDRSVLDRVYYEAVARMDASVVQGADWRERWWAEYCSALGVPGPLVAEAAAELRRREGPWSRVFPGSVEGLCQLAATGVAMGVISNSVGTVEQELLQGGVCQAGAGGFTEVLAVIDSHVVGVAKPDPAIFWLAAERAGVDPKRCWYVGDTVFYDVNGARAAGLRPIHLDPFGLCPHVADHDHVTSLAQVTALGP